MSHKSCKDSLSKRWWLWHKTLLPNKKNNNNICATDIMLRPCNLYVVKKQQYHGPFYVKYVQLKYQCSITFGTWGISLSLQFFMCSSWKNYYSSRLSTEPCTKQLWSDRIEWRKEVLSVLLHPHFNPKSRKTRRMKWHTCRKPCAECICVFTLSKL